HAPATCCLTPSVLAWLSAGDPFPTPVSSAVDERRQLALERPGSGRSTRGQPAAASGIRRAAKLAAQRLAQEQPGQTLQATALLHEAYLRLIDTENVQPWITPAPS